jgi:hypothetical protein
VADFDQSGVGFEGQIVHAQEGQFRCSIAMVYSWAKKCLLILQIMLHNQDSDMLVMDPNNKNSVFRMDLERGKIVDEWKVHDSVNVDNIIPE